MRKRVAAEHEAATLQRQLQETQALLQAQAGADGEGAEEGKGAGEGEGEREEAATLVLKEQLSGLRELKPAFHASYGVATTEFKVRGGQGWMGVWLVVYVGLPGMRTSRPIPPHTSTAQPPHTQTQKKKVRGPTYMSDGVKVTDAPPPLFELVHMELLDVSTHPDTQSRTDHVTQLFQSRGADGPYARCRTLASAPPPFLLVLNFQVPGNPPCSMMAYFALSGPRRRRLEALRARLRAQRERREKVVGRDEAKTQGEGFVVDEEEEEEDGGAGQGPGTGFAFPPPPTQPGAVAGEEQEEGGGVDWVNEREEKALRLLAAFLEGDDAYRNARFKLIPAVVEGPFLIRMSVGNKPVLLGTKLTQRYWSGPGYLEVRSRSDGWCWGVHGSLRICDALLKVDGLTDWAPSLLYTHARVKQVGIDIGSSSVASSVLGLVRDYSKNIVVEIAVLVQVRKGASGNPQN